MIMISQSNSLLNQSLPPLRTLFPDSVFKPVAGQCQSFVPLKSKSPEELPPLGLSSPFTNDTGGCRVSRSSNSSTPPLSFSPSPSPQLPSSAEFRLVPCSLNRADVVITHSKGTSAAILVGSAMQRAMKEDRKVHPYRVIRKN